MKLYHKQLDGIAHLRKEKKRLKKAAKKAARKAAAATVVSKDNPLGAFAGIADMLGVDTKPASLVGLGLPLARMVLKKAVKGGTVKKVATEVLGGYIKWKVIEMGLGVVTRIVRAQRQKAAARKRMR